MFCTCTPSQRADRKVCPHSIWVHLNLFNLAEDDLTIAQVYIDEMIFRKLSSACPDQIPDRLQRCLEKTNRRNYHPRVSSHSKFEEEQIWQLERKTGRPSRCSSCLVKDKITDGTVHASVRGLLYLQEDDRVVETTLRFCAKKNCVTNIKNSKISVRNLNTMIIIPAETLVLSEIERQNIVEEGFIIS